MYFGSWRSVRHNGERGSFRPGCTRAPRAPFPSDQEGRFSGQGSSRVLNPRFIEGLKPHGYRGVQEITKIIEYTYGWDVTSDAADDWEYQAFAEHFLFDESNKQWIEENNPYALHKMASKLLEANDRGFWETDEETIRKLQEIYLEGEDALERTGNDDS